MLPSRAGSDEVRLRLRTVDQTEEGVLITGVFGAGKSSAAEEIADILENRGSPYAVLDLDWLAWFGPEDPAPMVRSF